MKKIGASISEATMRSNPRWYPNFTAVYYAMSSPFAATRLGAWLAELAMGCEVIFLLAAPFH
jgi:hypothetical protein